MLPGSTRAFALAFFFFLFSFFLVDRRVIHDLSDPTAFVDVSTVCATACRCVKMGLAGRSERWLHRVMMGWSVSRRISHLSGQRRPGPECGGWHNRARQTNGQNRYSV